MNVYLLLIDDDRFFFYSAEDEDEDAGKDKNAGLDGGDDVGTGPDGSWTSRLAARLTAKLQNFKDAWQHAESGVLGKVHRCWDWLHTFIHPQESMLVRLYWARRIELFHPASRSADARAIWQDYLRGRSRYHLAWCAVNALIVPIVTPLALLPGPNFIGYWFMYRAIHHALIVLGIRRARREKVPTTLTPSEALDCPIHLDGEGKAAHSIFRGDGQQHRLNVYYEWSGGKRQAPPEAPRPDPIGHGDR